MYTQYKYILYDAELSNVHNLWKKRFDAEGL